MRTIRWTGILVVGIAAAVWCGPAAAQDTRQASEPKIPPACSTLEARLTAPSGVLSDADEQRLDTARIQQAIDRCPAGRAVILRAHHGRNVFLTGPLTLKSGVTLVVDANTVLAASRDPRVFDITPGSCGVVSAHGHGCKGLISADKTSGSGIMGDGSIFRHAALWTGPMFCGSVYDTRRN
ncbi:MAG: hypothetical protein WCC27_09160 [Acidobacteriaceae bacterium]